MPRGLDSLVGGTIAVPAEIPQAIVLANSFRRFHPQNEFAILLLDQPQPGYAKAFPRGTRLLYPAELGLEGGEEWRLPMLYLIEAFTRAFQPGEGPVLVIKTINGEHRNREMEKLRHATRGRPDIILRVEELEAEIAALRAK